MAYTDIDKSSDYFETKLYTGTGATQSITGLEFAPEMVWFKGRSVAYNNHIYDIIRGTTKAVMTNLTNAETTYSDALTAFNSDGYTIGANANVNESSATYASWNWKANGAGVSNTDGSITSTVSANTTSGFSIVSYTGTGANATVGHGLGVAPSMIIVKSRSSTDWWLCYHKTLGATKRLALQRTDASATQSNVWNDTEPTSSVFTVGTNSGTNASGQTYIAYCFAEKKGFSKFGSYTGNGSTTDGTFVYTGHSVAWVMIKQSNEARDWVIYDNKRDAFNVKDNFIVPNSSNAEGSGNTSLQIDFLSNGFKLRGGNHALNKSGGSYIYMAFAENPFVTSTSIPTTAR